jgi:hypothetical protein
MARLLACPFCRELYAENETRRCPECGVNLQPMDQLPPSLEQLHQEALEGDMTLPEDRPLPWTYLARGRGALLVLAVLGLIAFFLPWVVMRKPEVATFSGFDLARGRGGWLWGGAVAWFVMIPLVATRRTISRMRGVRIITVLFAAMTLGEVGMLMSLPPSSSRFVTVDFSWGWGLYLSGIIATLGVIAAARFGGKLDDLPALPWEKSEDTVHTDTSAGHTLH